MPSQMMNSGIPHQMLKTVHSAHCDAWPLDVALCITLFTHNCLGEGGSTTELGLQGQHRPTCGAGGGGGEGRS